jgi:hypothetical protein
MVGSYSTRVLEKWRQCSWVVITFIGVQHIRSKHRKIVNRNRHGSPSTATRNQQKPVSERGGGVTGRLVFTVLPKHLANASGSWILRKSLKPPSRVAQTGTQNSQIFQRWNWFLVVSERNVRLTKSVMLTWCSNRSLTWDEPMLIWGQTRKGLTLLTFCLQTPRKRSNFFKSRLGLG